MDEKDGEFLINLARNAITEYRIHNKVINPPENTKEELKEKRGVFVTLLTYPEKNLRGCIGFPEPVKPLSEATIEAAISSATNDPRFYPVRIKEMKDILIEVTVLTTPKELLFQNPVEILENINIGRHGLIIEKGLHRGLLLPQVPVEQGWSKEEFLDGLCMKAGLPPDAWREKDTTLYQFEGIIFTENQPSGTAVKKGP